MIKRLCIEARPVAVETDGRRLRALIAAESVDREHDVLVADGAELAAYLRNPVLLWAHQAERPPIGRALALEVEPGVGLWAENEFAPTAFAQELFELYRGGFLHAFSVGFRPLASEPRAGGRGRIIHRWELIEQSCVPVPANPDALVAAAGEGNRTAGWLLKTYYPHSAPSAPQTGGPTWAPSTPPAPRAPNGTPTEPIAPQPGLDRRGASMDQTMTELKAIAEQIRRDHDPERLVGALREVLAQAPAAAPRAGGPHLGALEAAGGEEQRAGGGLREILARPARDERERELQRLNDRVFLASRLLRRDPRGLRSWRDWQRRSGELSRALNLTDNEEFVPESFSLALVEEVRAQRRLPTLFESVRLPRSPLRWPVEGGIGLPYLVGEPATDTPSLVPTRTPGTNEVTFAAKTIAVRVPFSHEFDEDSIVAAEDYVRRQIAKSLTDGLEAALLNGDTSSPHMDGVVSATNDVRRTFDGLRRLARRPTVPTETDASTFGQASWLGARRALGVYGLDPAELVCIIGVKAYYRLLGDATNWGDFQTLDKIGPRAVNLTGEVGALYGVPVVVSSYVPETCAGTALDDGTGTDSLFLLANRRCFGLATQVGPTIETVWDAEALQFKVIGYQRVDFQPWFNPTTERAVSVGYGVSVS